MQRVAWRKLRRYHRRMQALGWIGLCFLGASLTACGPPLKATQTAEEYREEASKAYDNAVVSYLEEDWETAVRKFVRIRQDFSFTRYARLAELRLADAAFRQDKFAEAAAMYKSFSRDYPSDPELPYARYRAVRSQFLQAGSSVFQPPLEERDLASVRGAYMGLRAFLSDFPKYEQRAELDYMLSVVTGVLARHELYVARFYLREGHYRPAIDRARYALARYGVSGLEPEAIVLMGETYLKAKNKPKAMEAFRRVLAEYPTSPFVVPAAEFLQFLADNP